MTKRDRNKKIVQKPLSCTIFVIESKTPEAEAKVPFWKDHFKR